MSAQRTPKMVAPKAQVAIQDDGKKPKHPVTKPTAITLLDHDPQLDRQIIEGMLRDRDLLLDHMESKGYNRNAVVQRAADLGLSEAMVRQVRGVAADLAGDRTGSTRRPVPSSLGARTCLSCDRVFLSNGPANRLCSRCRGGDAGLAQL